MEYAEEVTINYINYRPLSEVTIHCHHNGYYKLVNLGFFFYYYYLYYFINVFAKNYVVINCLIELIRFIVYNVTTYIPANFKFLTNST